MATVDTETRITLGEASVDSGCLYVVDPCYIDRDPDPIPGGWSDGLPVAEWQEPYQQALGRSIYSQMEPVASTTVRQGVIFGTQIGDGQYPVVAVLDWQGTLLRVEILIAQGDDRTAADTAAPDVPDGAARTIPIPCPACASTENIAVVQTNGARCVIDGRDEVSGAYNFVGMSLGADGLIPAYDDELVDDRDAAGLALLRCLDCGHEWRDSEDVPF